MVTQETIEDFQSQGYYQLCVWPGTLVVQTPEEREERIKQFEGYFADTLGVRIKYLEEVETNPDLDKEGRSIPGTGGRNDVFFLVHTEDLSKFAIQRLQFGIRWYSDVIASINHGTHLYPEEILDKYGREVEYA